MKVRFLLPLFLKPLAGDQREVEVRCEGATVGDALRALFALHPAVEDRVMNERFQVRPHVNVFVGDEAIRFTGGLSTEVHEGECITVLPAVSGGR